MCSFDHPASSVSGSQLSELTLLDRQMALKILCVVLLSTFLVVVILTKAVIVHLH